jgi:hypothetical protein
MEGYDIAQICLNGHIIASTAGSSPQFRKKRCDICGEETIMKCPNCNDNIKGYYHVPGFLDTRMHYDLPRFCENCGKPYPWINTKLKAVEELVELMDSLKAEEKQDLIDSINELVRETSKVPVAKVKLKRYLKIVDSDISDGLTEILRETLKEKVFNSII